MKVFIKLFLVISIFVGFLGAESLKVASFNIQVFGKSKMSKPEVSTVLASIVSRYDVIFIQEIRDKSSKSIVKLQDLVNLGLPEKEQYDLLVSDRLGTTKSKEQYAFLFKKSKLKFIEEYQYRGTSTDFNRDPFSVKFNFENKYFVLTGIHIDPDIAVRELNLLDDALGFISRKMKTKDIILMGDLNADCSYVTSYKLKYLDLKRKKDFVWHISDKVDTTISKTDCAYDRIISMKTISPYIKNARVYNFDKDYNLTYKEAKKVSDHYPVEFELEF